MKKFVAINLLVLYLVAVSDTMVQLHFCGNRLTTWNINNTQPACCCKTSAKTDGIKKEDCCKNKVITLKLAGSQNVQPKLLPAFNDFVALLPAPTGFSFPEKFLSGSTGISVYRGKAPPPGIWQNIPLYKLHARFTYYG
ncbi:MAG: hypothetical protein QM642_10730 [Edaphocola sp.]